LCPVFGILGNNKHSLIVRSEYMYELQYLSTLPATYAWAAGNRAHIHFPKSRGTLTAKLASVINPSIGNMQVKRYLIRLHTPPQQIRERDNVPHSNNILFHYMMGASLGDLIVPGPCFDLYLLS